MLKNFKHAYLAMEAEGHLQEVRLAKQKENRRGPPQKIKGNLKILKFQRKRGYTYSIQLTLYKV